MRFRTIRATTLKHVPTGKTWCGWANDIPAAMRRRRWAGPDCVFRYPGERTWRNVTDHRVKEEK